MCCICFGTTFFLTLFAGNAFKPVGGVRWDGQRIPVKMIQCLWVDFFMGMGCPWASGMVLWVFCGCNACAWTFLLPLNKSRHKGCCRLGMEWLRFVNVFAVAYVSYIYQENHIFNRIDSPVIAYAYSPKIIKAF
jgi:hypothetical protein